MSDLAEIEALVRQVAVAQVITTSINSIPEATLLPIIWDGDRLLAHAAAANPQFQRTDDPIPALAVVSGPDAYISPMWYPTRRRQGHAVPTWNYLAAHFTGTLTLHRDKAWLRVAVHRLTELHERDRTQNWRMEMAPDRYLDGMLGGIIGLELQIESIEAKAKLSQNRVQADRASVIDALREEATPGAQAVAEEMATREELRGD